MAHFLYLRSCYEKLSGFLILLYTMKTLLSDIVFNQFLSQGGTEAMHLGIEKLGLR